MAAVEWEQWIDSDAYSLFICGGVPCDDGHSHIIVAEWGDEEWINHSQVIPPANVPNAMLHVALWMDIPDPEEEKLMQKYERVIERLAENDSPTMKVFGRSMLPIIKSGSKLTFRKDSTYEIGDVVFCKVKGRYIDAHKITKIDSAGRRMIANNKGRENGWASQIYGRVVAVDGEPFGRSPANKSDL